MNCPNCGAPMALTNASWRCDHCETVIVPQPVAGEDVRVMGEGRHACPVCHIGLERALIDDREPIEVCRQCRGMLMAQAAFAETLVARRGTGDASRPPQPGSDSELDRPLECPSCGGRMLTDWYYGGGRIVIDTCPGCSLVWLDAGELQRAAHAYRASPGSSG